MFMYYINDTYSYNNRITIPLIIEMLLRVNFSKSNNIIFTSKIIIIQLTKIIKTETRNSVYSHIKQFLSIPTITNFTIITNILQNQNWLYLTNSCDYQWYDQ